MMNNEAFVYKVDDDFNHIFDEKGNTFLALRKVYWGDSTEPKLDLRKWYTTPNGEKIGKGFGFLTEEGPGELARILLEKGYGETDQIIEAIKDRDNFKSSLIRVLGNETQELGIDLEEGDTSDIYYDPKEVLI